MKRNSKIKVSKSTAPKKEEESSSDGRDKEDQAGGLRKELTDMPLGELLKLREKVGTKLYNKAVFGNDVNDESSSSSKAVDNKQSSLKRKNPKRPREQSSKGAPTALFEESAPKSKRWDPRFDPRCGNYDPFYFKQQYGFILEKQNEEKEILKQELRKTEDPATKGKIKKHIKAMDDRQRAEQEAEKSKERIRNLRKDNMERLKEGKAPFYVKKSELKRRQLEEKYEELKKGGKVDKYLKRKSKRRTADEDSFMFDD